MSLSSFKTCSCQLPVFAAPPLPAPACCQCALRSAQELYCPQQVLRDFASPVQSCFFHSEENTFKARRQTQITCFCSDPLPSRPAPLPSSYTTCLMLSARIKLDNKCLPSPPQRNRTGEEAEQRSSDGAVPTHSSRLALSLLPSSSSPCRSLRWPRQSSKLLPFLA